MDVKYLMIERNKYQELNSRYVKNNSWMKIFLRHFSSFSPTLYVINMWSQKNLDTFSRLFSHLFPHFFRGRVRENWRKDDEIFSPGYSLQL